MAEAATGLTWTGLLRGMARWLQQNLPRALVMSAASFAFGWVVNFWVMAFRWDGFRAPMGESDYIAAQNSLIAGSVFWAGLTSFLFAVLAYGHRAGWDRLREELFGLPGRVRAMFDGEERNRSLTTLTWAIALSLLLALVVSPGAAAIAAGFFLVFAATPLGDLLAGVIRRLWMQVVARFAPHKGEPTSEVGAAAVTAAGMLAGFVIAATVDVFLLKALAIVVAALAAYYFANEDELGTTGGTAVFLLIAAAVGLYELFEAGVGVALADDGGWSECGDCNIIDYITSTGATEVVSRSTVAGGAAAAGAPIGASVGDLLGSIGGGSGDVGGGGGGGGGTGDGGSGSGGDGGRAESRTGDDEEQPAAEDGDVLGAIGGGAGGVGGESSSTTITLTGDAARAALAGGVDSDIDIPEDEQWDLDVSGGGRRVRSGHRGTRGRITGIGPVLEGEDGELVVSVDVETGDEVPPPPPPPDPEPRGEREGQGEGEGAEPKGEEEDGGSHAAGDGEDEGGTEAGQQTAEGAGAEPTPGPGAQPGGGVEFVDADDDGTPEEARVDTDGDGQPDLLLLDDDQDGDVDSAFADVDGDGAVDVPADPVTGVPINHPMDTSGDGTPDVVHRDTDGDGRIDTTAHDTDGDGEVDHLDVDTDGDGIADTRVVDDERPGIINQVLEDRDGDGSFETTVRDEGADDGTDADDADADADDADTGTPPPPPPPATPRTFDRDGDGIDDRYELVDEDGTTGPSTAAGLRTHRVLDRLDVPAADREQLVSFADGETNEAYLPPLEGTSVKLPGPGGVSADLQLQFWEQNGDAVRVYGTVEGYQVTADVEVVDGRPVVRVEGIDQIPIVGGWLSGEASEAIGRIASLDRQLEDLHVDGDGNLRIRSR